MLPEEVRQLKNSEAAKLRILHQKKYPDYKYPPTQAKVKKKWGFKKRNYKELISKLKDARDKVTQQQHRVDVDGNRERETVESVVSTLSEGKDDSSEPLYCECRAVWGEEDMVACDNESCPIEWFHFRCVQVTSKPRGKWFCPNCRGDIKAHDNVTDNKCPSCPYAAPNKLHLAEHINKYHDKSKPVNAENKPKEIKISDCHSMAEGRHPPYINMVKEAITADNDSAMRSETPTVPTAKAEENGSGQTSGEDQSTGPRVARRGSSDAVMRFCSAVRRDDELRKLRRENERLRSEVENLSRVRGENLRLREEAIRLKAELKKASCGKWDYGSAAVDKKGAEKEADDEGGAEEQPDYCWYSSFLEIPIAFPRDDHEL